MLLYMCHQSVAAKTAHFPGFGALAQLPPSLLAMCCQRHSPLLEDNVRWKLRSAGDTAMHSASHHRAFPDILNVTLCSSQKTIDGKNMLCSDSALPQLDQHGLPYLHAHSHHAAGTQENWPVHSWHASCRKKKAPCVNSPAYPPQQPCKQSNTFGSYMPYSCYWHHTRQTRILPLLPLMQGQHFTLMANLGSHYTNQSCLEESNFILWIPLFFVLFRFKPKFKVFEIPYLREQRHDPGRAAGGWSHGPSSPRLLVRDAVPRTNKEVPSNLWNQKHPH